MEIVVYLTLMGAALGCLAAVVYHYDDKNSSE